MRVWFFGRTGKLSELYCYRAKKRSILVIRKSKTHTLNDNLFFLLLHRQMFKSNETFMHRLTTAIFDSFKLTGNTTVSQQIRTEIKCSDCGKTATVPFKPTAGKPVYCRECLSKHRTPRTETRNRSETVHSSPDGEKQAWSRRRQDWK